MLRRAKGEEVKTETESDVSSVLSDSTPEPGFFSRVLTSHATNAQRAELRRKKEERKNRVKEKALRKKQRAVKRVERANRRAAGENVPSETERSLLSCPRTPRSAAQELFRPPE